MDLSQASVPPERIIGLSVALFQSALWVGTKPRRLSGRDGWRGRAGVRGGGCWCGSMAWACLSRVLPRFIGSAADISECGAGQRAPDAPRRM